MNGRITCEEFSAGLDAFISGRSGPEAADLMRTHMDSCPDCRDIYAMKKTLKADDPAVPESVEKELVEAVISDVAAARETGRAGKSWAQRYLVPAMAAAIVIFVFMTGFLLGEIRGLNREAGELREEVAAIETVLAGAGMSDQDGRGGSIFGRLAGGQTASARMTVGEAARLLKALPENTPVLTEDEAERLIAGDRRLRILAGRMEERPWKGGLTSGELLLFIVTLDLDPETRIPEEWTDARVEI